MSQNQALKIHAWNRNKNNWLASYTKYKPNENENESRLFNQQIHKTETKWTWRNWGKRGVELLLLLVLPLIWNNGQSWAIVARVIYE